MIYATNSVILYMISSSTYPKVPAVVTDTNKKHTRAEPAVTSHVYVVYLLRTHPPPISNCFIKSHFVDSSITKQFGNHQCLFVRSMSSFYDISNVQNYKLGSVSAVMLFVVQLFSGTALPNHACRIV